MRGDSRGSREATIETKKRILKFDRGIAAALGAAVLFGLSTPLAKSLVGSIPPLVLAGLLYVGSGTGLAALLILRTATGGRESITWPRGTDVGWLLGAVASGGAVGPYLLMYGLQATDAASASLILNLESVFTALLAWFVFKENFDRRIAVGMAFIVAGGAVLSAAPAFLAQGWVGPLAIAGACLAWAIDNNMTRRVSVHDAMLIACVKGLVAGTSSVALAVAYGAELPPASVALQAGVLGFVGYGLSLTLFVVALRGLGTARTGAYFSLAPFIGAALAVALGAPLTATLVVAGLLMGAGVWLHLTEHHEHLHHHDRVEHEHPHIHDEHHQHQHGSEWDGSEPHSHHHVHEPLQHAHAHYPDVHHRHAH
jgi:drug/metabolite transporter (DMT)-like permease